MLHRESLGFGILGAMGSRAALHFYLKSPPPMVPFCSPQRCLSPMSWFSIMFRCLLARCLSMMSLPIP